MSTVSSPAALPQYIEKLLSQRHDHVSAIHAIDTTLARVTAALGGSAPVSTPMKAAPVAKTAVAAAPKAKRKRTRSKGGITANEFVLEVIKLKKNPTTQEIKEAWKAANRPGSADNSLSMLTKAKQLKRTKLPGGGRGSRYALA